MAYEVHLEVFDGPFDLLLQLIAAQQVDVYEIRLADIVDGFIAECSRLEALDLELATEFLLIAATLVELKIRRLLPGSDDVDLDEELALYEARDYLLARLVECKTFSSAARVLAELEERAGCSTPRRAGPDERFDGLAPDLLAGVDPERLRRAALAAFAERPAPPSVEVAHLHEDEVSVAATFDDLRRRLPEHPRTTFRQLTAESASTAQLVACFLALLELYKRELVDLDQAATFGELRITWTGDAESAELAMDAAEFDLPPRPRQPSQAPQPSDAAADPASSGELVAAEQAEDEQVDEDPGADDEDDEDDEDLPSIELIESWSQP